MKLPRLETAVSSGSHKYKETTVLSHHEDYSVGQTTGGLSVLFTILCIVDLFGVFPVIALPKSVISCGIYGLPLVVSVFGLQLYTAVLLGRCWLLAQEITPDIRKKSRLPYAAVAELAFGVPARSLVTFLIDAAVFGAGVPNFILAAQSMQLFWWKISGGEIGITYCVWMLIIGLLLCPVMWLGSPKDMKPLAVTSVLIVSTVAICTWTCIMLDDVSPPSRGGLLEYQPSVEDFLIAYGIIAFQFDIHPLLLTIQVDMKDSRKINGAVLGGFCITISMFAVTTILAANRYGGDIHNNILQGIPPSYALYVVALLVTIQLCLSSAVGNSALFQHVEEFLRIPKDFCIRRCLLRSGIVAVAVFLGESVPRFDLVMGLIGSTLTGPLMFILPPLFFLKLCYMKSNLVNKGLYLIFDTQNDTPNGFQNGRTITQNGGQNTTEYGGHTTENGSTSTLLVPYHTKYETFTNYSRIGQELDKYKIKLYDIILALTVMLMGIAATIVATYSSWADTIRYATFTPPCLVNATTAARSFLEYQSSV
ncbi:probable sodium-coupled neutral amino acid transporter 6 [Plodia interpunctella]|uniref:probable sodium-coupled neutral amino acid transporter 6 n=1 Tax=Plodia interpunctella TaxID=58824 RepID=UPI0023684FA7|nr:probable sodium-coupled neutral amino acid transporter 6 [Plodia interpunctella]XP_053618518.1 probable sodium-coupled neutral amino acid transporter 6 [Plodia interpunctella]